MPSQDHGLTVAALMFYMHGRAQKVSTVLGGVDMRAVGRVTPPYCLLLIVGLLDADSTGLAHCPLPTLVC